MSDTTPKKFVFYHYDPSLLAAVIFIVLFSLTLLIHLFQMFRKRTWYLIPFIIGGIFEPIGYIGRAISAQQSPNWTLTPYIMQSLLLLLAPALFAASIYMVLGRIIRLTDGETHSIIAARWLTKIFVCGDVLSFLVQSSGGGLLAKAKDLDGQKLGENLIIAGLFIQLFFFGFFIVVAGLFHYRISLYPTTRSKSLSVPWQRHLGILYAASFLIMVRSTFRIVEYIMGGDGVLLQTEAYLYVFDATLMFVMSTLFNVWHPSEIIHRGHTSIGSMDSSSGAVEYVMENRGGGYK